MAMMISSELNEQSPKQRGDREKSHAPKCMGSHGELSVCEFVSLFMKFCFIELHTQLKKQDDVAYIEVHVVIRILPAI